MFKRVIYLILLIAILAPGIDHGAIFNWMVERRAGIMERRLKPILNRYQEEYN